MTFVVHFLILALAFLSAIKCQVAELVDKINSPTVSRTDFFQSLKLLEIDASLPALKACGILYFFGSEHIVPNYEKSFETLKRIYAMDNGDSEVLFLLGLHYSYGIACDMDVTKGLVFFAFSARLGNMHAQAAVGFAQRFGLGIERNCVTSKRFYYRAAKNALKKMTPKDAMSVRKPQRLQLKSSEPEKTQSQKEAIEFYEYSARIGDVSSNLLLGQLYYFGAEGQEPDAEMAREHFEKAQSLGSEAASSFLGQIYYRGEKVPVDYSRAFEYFLIGAKKEVPSALNGLGLLYWRGQHVSKNLDIAEAYLKRAVELKYPEAMYNYAMVLLEQPSVYNTDKIFEHVLAAVRSGYVFANTELVKRYLKSESTCILAVHTLTSILDKGPSLQMFREAKEYFSRGMEDQALSRYIFLAAQGFEVANFNAAYILDQNGDARHKARALFFYLRAATLGNSLARSKVGDGLYKKGDIVGAIANYLVAARSDLPNSEAFFNLGYSYEHGYGIKKDLYAAFDMYSASLANEKYAKIAVTFALAKLKLKLWLSGLKRMQFRKKSNKILRPNSERDPKKILTMFIALVLSCLIYWYINYFQHNPRQHLAPLRNEDETIEDAELYETLSLQSDSSGENEHQSRANSDVLNQEVSENDDEVD